MTGWMGTVDHAPLSWFAFLIGIALLPAAWASSLLLADLAAGLALRALPLAPPKIPVRTGPCLSLVSTSSSGTKLVRNHRYLWALVAGKIP